MNVSATVSATVSDPGTSTTATVEPVTCTSCVVSDPGASTTATVEKR